MKFRQPRDISEPSNTSSSPRKLVSGMPRIVLRMPSLVVPISIDEMEVPSLTEQESASETMIDLSVQSDNEPQEESLLLPSGNVEKEPATVTFFDQLTSSLNQPASDSNPEISGPIDQATKTETVAVDSIKAQPRQKLEADEQRKNRLRQVQGNQWRNGFFWTGVAACLLWMTYLVINSNPFAGAIDSLYTRVAEEATNLEIETGELAEAPAWASSTNLETTHPKSLGIIPTPFASVSTLEPPSNSIPLSPGNFQQDEAFKTEVNIVGPVFEELAPPLAANAQTENIEPTLNHDHSNPHNFNQSPQFSSGSQQAIPTVDPQQGSHWMKNDPRSTATRVSLAKRGTISVENPQLNGQWNSGPIDKTAQGNTPQNTSIYSTDAGSPVESQEIYSSYPVSSENRIDNSNSNAGPSYFAPLQTNHDDRTVPSQANLYGTEPYAPRTR